MLADGTNEQSPRPKVQILVGNVLGGGSRPYKLSGVCVFSGTMVAVSSLFGKLAKGTTVQDFLDGFPGVEERQVKAVLEQGAKSLDTKVIPSRFDYAVN